MKDEKGTENYRLDHCSSKHRSKKQDFVLQKFGQHIPAQLYISIEYIHIHIHIERKFTT